MRKMAKLKTLMLGVLFVLSGCAASPVAQYQEQSFYTQINLWFDKDRHLTTNYRVGGRVPINTRVKVVDASNKAIVVLLESANQEVHITNVPGYSGQDIEGIFKRYLGVSRVDLSAFGETVRKNIEDGSVEEGMTKEAVLLARGYPPSHQTVSLDMDLWTYWRNRFTRQTVEFENGKVSDLVGF